MTNMSTYEEFITGKSKELDLKNLAKDGPRKIGPQRPPTPMPGRPGKALPRFKPERKQRRQVVCKDRLNG